MLEKKYVKNNDTHPFLFTGSTVAVQQKDGGPWIHGVVEEVNGSNHKGQSYIIQVMNRLTDYMEHEAHAQQPNNCEAVST